MAETQEKIKINLSKQMAYARRSLNREREATIDVEIGQKLRNTTAKIVKKISKLFGNDLARADWS